MTILGDCAQTMEEEQQDVLQFLPGILGKQTRIILMKKSYRNTVEIANYANQIAGLTDMELLERHGKAVEQKPLPISRRYLKKFFCSFRRAAIMKPQQSLP